MPFVEKSRRVLMDAGKGDALPGDKQPGDLCYEFYREMVRKWKTNPRWTTAHQIYKDMRSWRDYDSDRAAAYELAWQVFFQLYVMPYEEKKREENGDI